jgi:hypothetical protein
VYVHFYQTIHFILFHASKLLPETLMGTGQGLKERSPFIQVVGIERPLGYRIQGLKTLTW